MPSVLENYLSGNQDPSVTATFGNKGQLFVRLGASGGLTYQKQDNGSTTNWILLPSASTSIGTSLFEDWITNGAGNLNWFNGNIGTGTSETGLAVASNNHPGILQLVASAVGDQGARYLGGASTGTAGFVLGGGEIILEYLVRLEDLSTAAQEYNFLVGMSDSANGTTNNIRFTYLRTTSVNWICVTTSAAISTTTITAVAVTEDTWIKLKIIINAAGTSVAFYIDEVLVATHATNIPTVAIAPRLRLLKNVGATARTAYIDYFKLSQTFTTSR